MKTPEVNEELALSHGLSPDEYVFLRERLGRVPSYAELGVISVMWSEHCSYKSSKVHLKTLPTTADWVIHGPGENAGVIDVGDGLAVVFKMESHNHPSFIEPYQGAATGVGGIMRDVFTMGARPVANLNSLRFGPLDEPRMRFLVKGVVAGIGGYGNCMGVPTVGGEIAFDESYRGNILVNAFTLGVARKERIFLSAASAVGSPVVYVGSKTGRDGIHGATMASEEFGEESESKRPRVQVGDPFTEKKLLEACLELMREDVILAIQDMGAAGLTSSGCEMAAKGGVGIDIDVAKVPRREEGMTPYEVMLSESQERMLMIIRPGTESAVSRVFEKWELDSAVIGVITDGKRLVVRDGAEVAADLPVDLLADEAPSYRREMRPPDFSGRRTLNALPDRPPEERLLALLKRPTIASKRWAYEQYDYSVRASTVLSPGQADAAVIRLPDHGLDPSPLSKRGVGMTCDCNGRFVFLDPRIGAARAVVEAATNLVCVGAEPKAISDCLNFGNPEKPEVMWSFAESVQGLKEACEALETPVVSGNVSLYNETDGQSILPTPTVAMVGLIENVDHAVGLGFQDEGDSILVIGHLDWLSLAGSELVLAETGEIRGTLQKIDFGSVCQVHEAILDMHQHKILKSAHDLAEGGLLVALAESVVSGKKGLGARIRLPHISPEVLFGEGPSLALLSVDKDDTSRCVEIAGRFDVPVFALGEVSGDHLVIDELVDVPVPSLRHAYFGGLEEALE